MKYYSTAIAFTGLLVSLITAGCECPNSVRSVRTLGVVDAAPNAPAKGYVEFMSVSRNVPIPIFQLDEQQNPYALAAIGLKPGDHYSYERHQMPVVENLRVTEPPGKHLFMIERDGERVEVPVNADQITPVEVNYVLLQQADAFKLYRMDYRVFNPVPYQKEKLGAPLRKETKP